MASLPHLVGTAYHPESGTARRNKPSDLSIGSVRRRQLLPSIRRVGGQETVRETRPDGWRGVQTREQVIKRALYGVLQDEAEVERIFLIIEAQKEY